MVQFEDINLNVAQLREAVTPSATTDVLTDTFAECEFGFQGERGDLMEALRSEGDAEIFGDHLATEIESTLGSKQPMGHLLPPEEKLRFGLPVAEPRLASDAKLEMGMVHDLYEDMKNTVMFFHGTLSPIADSIIENGLSRKEPLFEIEDIKFFHDIYTRTVGGEFPLIRDQVEDRNFITPDRGNAELYTRGPEVMHLVLDRMGDVKQSGSVSHEEYGRLTRIESEFSSLLERSSGVVLGVLGEALEHIHPDFSVKKGIEFVGNELKEFINDTIGEGTKGEFLGFIRDKYNIELMVSDVPASMIVREGPNN